MGVRSCFLHLDIRGQCILGKEEFAEGLMDYIKGYRDVKEIPKSQRYADRLRLDMLFDEGIIKKTQQNGIR